MLLSPSNRRPRMSAHPCTTQLFTGHRTAAPAPRSIVHLKHPHTPLAPPRGVFVWKVRERRRFARLSARYRAPSRTCDYDLAATDGDICVKNSHFDVTKSITTIIAILLVAAMAVFSLCGCSSKDDAAEVNGERNSAADS